MLFEDLIELGISAWRVTWHKGLMPCDILRFTCTDALDVRIAVGLLVYGHGHIQSLDTNAIH